MNWQPSTKQPGTENELATENHLLSGNILFGY
jgi:hypothetical protein